MSIHLGFSSAVTGLARNASPYRDLPPRTARLAMAAIYITRGASLHDRSLLSHTILPVPVSITSADLARWSADVAPAS